MFLKVNYTDDSDKEKKILLNKNLYLLEIADLLEEKYLIFSDKKYATITEDIENKISILIEGQKALLRGDMQEVAFLHYPEDFSNRVLLDK